MFATFSGRILEVKRKKTSVLHIQIKILKQKNLKRSVVSLELTNIWINQWHA